MMSFVARLCRLMPLAIERAHLLWALEEIDPLHPDIGSIYERLHELDRRTQRLWTPFRHH